MAESYLKLSADDRLEALGVAATGSGRPIHLLEKDIWVVWALQGLIESKLGEHLVFKGGTSRSKGYERARTFRAADRASDATAQTAPSPNILPDFYER